MSSTVTITSVVPQTGIEPSPQNIDEVGNRPSAPDDRKSQADAPVWL